MFDSVPENQETVYYETTEDGRRYYGRHLLIDIYDGKNLHKTAVIEECIREIIRVCGMVELFWNIHSFGEDQEYGATAAAGLSTSHISIHTWPETGYAAMDIYTCGTANPNDGVPVIQKHFEANDVRVLEIRRGLR